MAFVPGGTTPARAIPLPGVNAPPTVNLQNLAKALQSQNTQNLQQTLAGIQQSPLAAGNIYNQLKQLTGGNRPYTTPLQIPFPGGGGGGGGRGSGGGTNEMPYDPAKNLAMTIPNIAQMAMQDAFRPDSGPTMFDRQRDAAQAAQRAQQQPSPTYDFVSGGDPFAPQNQVGYDPTTVGPPDIYSPQTGLTFSPSGPPSTSDAMAGIDYNPLGGTLPISEGHQESSGPDSAGAFQDALQGGKPTVHTFDMNNPDHMDFAAERTGLSTDELSTMSSNELKTVLFGTSGAENPESGGAQDPWAVGEGDFGGGEGGGGGGE